MGDTTISKLHSVVNNLDTASCETRCNKGFMFTCTKSKHSRVNKQNPFKLFPPSCLLYSYVERVCVEGLSASGLHLPELAESVDRSRGFCPFDHPVS